MNCNSGLHRCKYIPQSNAQLKASSLSTPNISSPHKPQGGTYSYATSTITICVAFYFYLHPQKAARV